MAPNIPAELRSLDPVVRRIEARVRERPNAAAILDGGVVVSFAALDAAADGLADLAIQYGICREDAVGVCLDRSADYVIALLAVMKAAGRFVPVSPERPPQRIAEIFRDSGVSLVLTHLRHADALPQSCDRVFLDELSFEHSTPPVVRSDVEGGDAAYTIYTSGSSGLPKGVTVTHDALAMYCGSLADRLPTGSPGSLFHSAVDFDFSLTSVFVPLLRGERLDLLPAGSDGSHLAEALVSAATPYSFVRLTPSHIGVIGDILRHRPEVLQADAFLVGGEALTHRQLSILRELAPRSRIFNHYGPTEAVIGCCVYEVDHVHASSASVPIGQALPGRDIYLLDRNLERVPHGEIGELFVGGRGLARGYHAAPALTAQRFMPDPHGAAGRMYRTGDLARVLPDGNLEFMGRIDDQVKIRGFRVEPGEIQTALLKHRSITDARVITWKEHTGSDIRLVAYVLSLNPDLGTSDVRAFLAENLPDYMVPAYIVVVAAWPISVNGKVDLAALPHPERPPSHGRPPRTAMEKCIAEIWSDVLRVDDIAVGDNFFELGGDSILALRVIAAAQRVGVRLSQADIFGQETLGDLARVAIAAS